MEQKSEQESEKDFFSDIASELRCIIYTFLDGISLTRLLRVSKTTNQEIVENEKFKKLREQARAKSAIEKTLHILNEESKIGYIKNKSNTIDTPPMSHLLKQVSKEKAKAICKSLGDQRSKSFNTYNKAQINIYRHMSWEEREKYREEQSKKIEKIKIRNS